MISSTWQDTSLILETNLDICLIMLETNILAVKSVFLDHGQLNFQKIELLFDKNKLYFPLIKFIFSSLAYPKHLNCKEKYKLLEENYVSCCVEKRNKKVETQCFKPTSPGLQKNLLQILSEGKYTNLVPKDFHRLGLGKKNLMIKVHQTLMKMNHHSESR